MLHVNGLRLVADGLHLFALGLILVRLFAKQDAQGISLKTQDLILIVSLVRHLSLDFFFDRQDDDIHSSYVISIYFVSIKVVSTVASIVICYAMRHISHVKSTYRPDLDTVRHWINIFFPVTCFSLFILTPCCLSGMSHLFWSFSLLLGAACLVPQISMLRYHSQMDTTYGEKFVFLMGASYICFLMSCRDTYMADFEYLFQSDFDYLMPMCITVFLFSTAWMAFWELKRAIPNDDSNEVNIGASQILVCCGEIPWLTVLILCDLFTIAGPILTWIGIFLVVIYFRHFYLSGQRSQRRNPSGINEGTITDLENASESIQSNTNESDLPSIAERVAYEQRQLALEACVEDHETDVSMERMDVSSTFAILAGWIFVFVFAIWGTPLALCSCVALAGYVILKNKTSSSSHTAQEVSDDLNFQETFTPVHTVSADQELGTVTVPETHVKPTNVTLDPMRDPLLTAEERSINN